MSVASFVAFSFPCVIVLRPKCIGTVQSLMCVCATQELAKIYFETRAQGHRFEIIFVSSDKDYKSFAAFAADMPWPAVSFFEKSKLEQLRHIFGVAGVPALVLLDELGRLITKEGLLAVHKGFPFGAPFRNPVDPQGPPFRALRSRESANPLLPLASSERTLEKKASAGQLP
jgi:hypothetical protein